jgi:hypothetical protein
MTKGDTSGKADDLVIRGRFEHLDGTPVVGAAVHQVFLGDPPSNCGTCFDLEKAPAHTDGMGEFRLALKELDKRLAPKGLPGCWRRGCFLILCVKDASTLGYVIASGDELSAPALLRAIPRENIRGIVQTEDGLPVPGARVEVYLYLLFVGSGPNRTAPVNFWLSRPSRQPGQPRQRITDLVAFSGPDGHFVIPNAPMMPGQLRLTVSHPDFATREIEHYPFQPMLRLALQPGAMVGFHATLADGKPAVGSFFCLSGVPEGTNWAIHQDGVTDEGGQLQFRSLLPGSYTVRFLGGANGPWAIPAIPVPSLRKGEQRELEVQAVEGSILCGRVLSTESKKPLVQAEVRFESETYPATASTVQAAYTNAEGEFAFRYAVAAGLFDICVSAWDRGKRYHEWHQVSVGSEPRTEMTFYLPVPEA